MNPSIYEYLAGCSGRRQQLKQLPPRYRFLDVKLSGSARRISNLPRTIDVCSSWTSTLLSPQTLYFFFTCQEIDKHDKNRLASKSTFARSRAVAARRVCVPRTHRMDGGWTNQCFSSSLGTSGPAQPPESQDKDAKCIKEQPGGRCDGTPTGQGRRERGASAMQAFRGVEEAGEGWESSTLPGIIMEVHGTSCL